MDRVKQVEALGSLPDRIRLRCVIDAAGGVHLARVLTEMELMTRDKVRALVSGFRFDRALLPEGVGLVLAEFEILTESFEFEFPFDVRTLGLRSLGESLVADGE